MMRYTRRFRRSKKLLRILDKLWFVELFTIRRRANAYFYNFYESRKRPRTSYIPRYIYRFIRKCRYLIKHLDHDKSIYIEVDKITRDAIIIDCQERIHPADPFCIIYLRFNDYMSFTILEIKLRSIYIDYDLLRYLDSEKVLSTIILS